jgi:hypothetical protein
MIGPCCRLQSAFHHKNGNRIEKSVGKIRILQKLNIFDFQCDLLMMNMTLIVESFEPVIEIKDPIPVVLEKEKIFDVWDISINDPNPQMFSD